jgi:hypothetical protein
MSEEAKREPGTSGRVKIVEQDGDVVEIVAQSSRGEIRVITELRRKGKDLWLTGLHMEGPGPRTAGIRELRELAREFGRDQGVSRIIIEGGVRTTGANRGHKPRRIVIPVEGQRVKGQ